MKAVLGCPARSVMIVKKTEPSRAIPVMIELAIRFFVIIFRQIDRPSDKKF